MSLLRSGEQDGPAAKSFSAFDRGDRGLGVRDVVLVVPSVGCTNRVVEVFGRSRPDVRFVTHQHGCSQLGSDLAMTQGVLCGACANPNVRGAVVVSLGCESNEPTALVAKARERGANVRLAGFQNLGGTNATVQAVGEFVDEMLAEPAKRRDVTLGDLTVGLLGDAPTDGLRDALESLGVRTLVGHSGAPDGEAGGAATVHGAWAPQARRRLPLARALDATSLVERMTAFTAAGAQLVVFLTARGDPTASPIAPTLKVGVNPALAGVLEGVVDFDADPSDARALAERVVRALDAAAAGEPTAGERAGQRDFGIPRLSPTL